MCVFFQSRLSERGQNHGTVERPEHRTRVGCLHPGGAAVRRGRVHEVWRSSPVHTAAPTRGDGLKEKTCSEVGLRGHVKDNEVRLCHQKPKAVQYVAATNHLEPCV